MIHTFLPEDFAHRKDILKVYGDLVEKIASGCKNLEVYHKGNLVPLYTEKQVREFLDEFLLSKNFYEYVFTHEDGFWYDLKRLPGVCSVSGVLGKKKTDSDAVHFFRAKYSEKENLTSYQRLIPYKGLRLYEFRKKVAEGEKMNPVLRLEKAFNYEQLDSGYRHTILNAMDVTVCPYCNMNYTIRYNNGSDERNTADIDHFYVKEKYPEYALCLYNMVPSCPVCNSRMKLNQQMTREKHIYPHEESFNGVEEIRVSNLVPYLLGKEEHKHAYIGFEPVPDADPEIVEKAERSAGVFQLEARYQSVHGYAEELIDNAKIYTEGYTEELEREFANVFGGTSIREMVFGPEEDEKHYAQRSLGKMRMDLLHQLKIY